MSAPQTKPPSELAAYADLFQRLLDATFLVEPETQVILEANGACERMLGLETDKIVGLPLVQWIEEECREEFDKALRMAMRRYYPRQFDTRIKLPDGKIVHLEVLACPLVLSDQREVIQVLARDVSFKRDAEAKMQVLLRKLEVLSTVDEMTGLFNFRHFKAELHKEHTRAMRFSTPYSIVFCDIDHFKKYNDRNGHPAGDELLRAFAATLLKSSRSSDLVARYGGEEFAIICPGVDASGARVLAERIRAAVSATQYPHSRHQPLGCISISIGVSSFPAHGKTPDEVLKASDEAVYLAKAGGRNRVILATIIKVKKTPKSAA